MLRQASRQEGPTAGSSSGCGRFRAGCMCQTGSGEAGLKLAEAGRTTRPKNDYSHHSWGGGAYYMEAWGSGPWTPATRRTAEEAFRKRWPTTPGACGPPWGWGRCAPARRAGRGEEVRALAYTAVGQGRPARKFQALGRTWPAGRATSGVRPRPGLAAGKNEWEPTNAHSRLGLILWSDGQARGPSTERTRACPARRSVSARAVQLPGGYWAERGQPTCYVCETAEKPGVIVFARSLSDPLVKLLAACDQAVADRPKDGMRGVDDRARGEDDRAGRPGPVGDEGRIEGGPGRRVRRSSRTAELQARRRRGREVVLFEKTKSRWPTSPFVRANWTRRLSGVSATD